MPYIYERLIFPKRKKRNNPRWPDLSHHISELLSPYSSALSACFRLNHQPPSPSFGEYILAIEFTYSPLPGCRALLVVAIPLVTTILYSRVSAEPYRGLVTPCRLSLIILSTGFNKHGSHRCDFCFATRYQVKRERSRFRNEQRRKVIPWDRNFYPRDRVATLSYIKSPRHASHR